MKLDTALRTVAASSAAPIHATIVFCGAPALVRAASQMLLQRSPAATFRAEEVPPQTTEGEQAAARQEDAADRRSAFSVVDVFHRGIMRCVFVAPGCFEGGADSLIPDASASSPSLSCSVVAAFAHCAAPATAAKQVLVRELHLQQQQQQHRDEDAVSTPPPAATSSLLSLDVFEAVCLAIDPLGSAAGLSVAPLALPASFLRNAAGSESLFASLFAATVSANSSTNVDLVSKQSAKNLPAVAIASGRNRPGRSEQLVQRALRAFSVIAAEARVAAQARAPAESAAPAAASVEKSWSEWTVRKLHDARGKNGVLAAFKTAATATETAVVAVPVPADKQDDRQASLTHAAVTAIAEALASLHARHAAATPAAFDHSLRQANVAFERKQNRLLLQQQQQQREEQQALQQHQHQNQRHANDSGGDEEPLVAHEDVGSLSETDRILRALMAKRQSMSLARRAEEWIAQFSAQAVPAPLRALAVKLPHTWRFWLTPMGIIAMGTGLMMLVGVVLIFMS